MPKIARKNPEMLWVRLADRLEAIGTIGAVRCWQYNSEKGAPLSVPTTPQARTVAEVWQNVTPERLDNYMRTKTSDSMMDHYFDKLLQIAKFDPKTTQNDFLVNEAANRVDPLVQICLEFGKEGKVPINTIRRHAGLEPIKEEE